MGYQFVHIESYGRRAGKGKAGGNTVGKVLAEANRHDGYCPHVKRPSEPNWIIGSAEIVAKSVTEYAERTMDPAGRKLRSDGLCMVGGVVSAPDDLSDEGWQQMKADSITFLRNCYGERLRGFVEHTDESHRHCHFYLVPLPGERFSAVHPGRAAAEKAAAEGAVKGEQNAAYREAMRAFQNEWHAAVSAAAGLTRFGPKRRRLRRNEWKAEQEQAKTLAGELRDVRRLRRELERLKSAMSDEHQKQIADLQQREQELRRQMKGLALSALTKDAEIARARADADAARAEADELRRQLQQIRQQLP